MRSRTSPALVLAALAACSHRGGAVDAGGPTTIIPTQGVDGGPDGGAPDGGGKVDAGPILFDGGNPVPVVVSRVSPDRGGVAGGTPVTLSGSGFLSGLLSDPNQAATVTTVSFGGNPSIGVTILTDGTLQVATPPGIAGAVDVTVANPNGSARCAGCFVYQATLQVAAVSPGQGPLAGGTSVAVTGLGFDATTQLLFGPHALIHPQLVSSTTMTGLTPPAALAGPVDVRAFNGNGEALLHGAFVYFARPSVLALSPAGGPSTGGTPVTLTGRGFLGEQPAVTFAGQAATAVAVVDDQTLTLVTPPGAVGPADVVVQDAHGTATLPGGFVYFPAGASQLAVYGVAPGRGPAAGGTSVVVVGAGFAGSPQVEFGGVAATGLVLLDGNDLQVVTPPGAIGPVPVLVTQAGSNASLAGAFTYYAGLSVTSASPASGPTAGGTQAVLSGSGFAAGDRVFVGALEAPSVQATGPTALSITVPPGSAGPADVEVISGSDPTITALLPSGYTYLDPFSLVQVAPASGSQAGGTYVQLFGTGFGLGVGATFAGSPAANVALVDAYTVSCLTPPGPPGPADVALTEPAPDGGVEAQTLPGGFSYFDPTNFAGGESGGPLDGTLNVTVLDSDYTASNQPLAGTLVRLGVDPRTPFQGLTDAHGQITFSDPSLVKAQTVTADYQGAIAVTVDGVASQNLTVFLDVPMANGSLPSSCPCGAPPDCPQNCGLPYCGALGSCVQCLTDADCQNPAIPGYDPTKPKCNPPPIAGTPVGGFCVQCIPEIDVLSGTETLPNPDCKGNPNGPACDDDRGMQSSYSCVQCSADQPCASPDYCTQQLTCAPPDSIEGAVYGFKLPPSVALTPTQHVEAHVGLLQPFVYAFEPFGPDPAETVVATEGGTFTINLDSGPLTVGLYAKFGIVDASTNPASFTPLLLGVIRGLHVDPSHPVTGANIILDTHLDQVAPISLLNTLAPPAAQGGVTDGNPVHYDTFAYLDLGQDGVVPLPDVDTTAATSSLGNLPPVAGSGLLFLTQAYQPPGGGQPPFADPSLREPASNFFRNVQGDFTAGVPMGPLLSFAGFTHPAAGGPLDGTFAWTFTDPSAPTPDLSQLTLYSTQVDGNGNQLAPLTQLWQVVVPGSQTSVTLPPDELAAMVQALPTPAAGASNFIAWSLVTALSPRFDYAFWSYQQLSELSWTGFQQTTSGTIP